MLLHASHSCPGARIASFTISRGLTPQLLVNRQQHPVQTHASRSMEVVAAAEATAKDLEGVRLDAALFVLFPGRWKSSTALKRTVRRGDILVNGTAAKVDHTMQLGDQVQVVTRVGCSGVDSCHRRQLQQSLPGLDVAWEDEHMAVVVKPQGLLSQGPKGAASVAGRVKYCLQPTPLPGALSSPVIAHRLDVGTGGLMMVAKTRAAATRLTRDLAEHNIQKRYLALVLGELTGSGVIDQPVGGCLAVSLFRVEGHRPSARFGCLTLVSLWPKTGRTHQLRKHMAYIGHPILGDLQYKRHRKPDCSPSAADIDALLPRVSAASQQQMVQLQQQQQQQQQQQHLQEQLHGQQLHVQQHMQEQRHHVVQQNAVDQQIQDTQQQQVQQQQQQQQPGVQGHEQQPQPVLEVLVPLLELPLFNGQNPFHNAKAGADFIENHANNKSSSSNAGGISNKAGPRGRGHTRLVAESVVAASPVPGSRTAASGRSHAVPGSSSPESGSSTAVPGSRSVQALLSSAAVGSSTAVAVAGSSPAGPSSSCAAPGSQGASSVGGKERGEVLQDGTVVGTCLWAVQLQLPHPVTGRVVDISMGDSVVLLYDRLCDLDAPTAV